MPKALPVSSGGKLAGRSTVEEGREEEEEEERKMENELMNAIVAEESRKQMQPSVKLLGKQHL